MARKLPSEPLIFAGLGLGALLLIRSILRETGIATPYEQTPNITTGEVPKDTNGQVCRPSYTKDMIRKIFPALVQQLKEAKGVFRDDYPAVIDVFAKIRNKGDFYLLNGIFSGLYKQDMMAYLRSFLNSSEMAPIEAKIKKLKC